MLIYFHKNKLRYNKGQLAPIFIVLLVILIIMAMVTVNLGKVAFIKTDSSNAVDAGALAAGSVMANVFNAVAQANSQMEASYWEFYATISVLFVIALTALTMAITDANTALTSAGAAAGIACANPCGAKPLAVEAVTSAAKAISHLSMFRSTTMAIGVAVTAFSFAQYFFYLSIRKMAKKGREDAIKLGHRFSFTNSGIGSKLKEGSPPANLVGAGNSNNYRDIYKQFLDGLGDNEEYTYSWQDGQDRGHFVYSKITIDEVDTFELRVTLLPSPVITALLISSSLLAYSAQSSLTTAEAAYAEAVLELMMACACYKAYLVCVDCCNPKSPACCACAAIKYACWKASCSAAQTALAKGIAANSAAIASMIPIFPLMAAAWAGLLPGRTITSSSNSDALFSIICWIDDIVHNRLVRADTTQHHAGADLGLWQTRYPDTQSYSVVDFRGRGQIHPPVLRHDASIIETDRLD